MENWQDIPGYEGIYQISDLGRVKSIRTGKILVIDHGKYGHGLAKAYRIDPALVSMIRTGKVWKHV